MCNSLHVFKTLARFLMLSVVLLSVAFASGCSNNTKKVVEKPSRSELEISKDLCFYANNEVIQHDKKLVELLTEASPFIKTNSSAKFIYMNLPFHGNQTFTTTYTTPEKAALTYLTRKCKQDLRNDVLRYGESESAKSKSIVFGDKYDYKGYMFSMVGKANNILTFNNQFFKGNDFAQLDVNPETLKQDFYYIIRLSGYISRTSIFDAVYLLDHKGNIITRDWIAEWTTYHPNIYSEYSAEFIEKHYNRILAKYCFDNNNNGSYGRIVGSYVTLKDNPGKKYKQIDELPKNTKVEIIEFIKARGPYSRYKIRLADGTIGYVDHMYIKRE